MNPADIINGTFEALASLFVLNHCRVLLRDRAVAGVSIASTAFFTLWGVWNCWYYPNLGQFWSFVGGLFVVVANTVYVGLLIRFSNTDSKSQPFFAQAQEQLESRALASTVNPVCEGLTK